MKRSKLFIAVGVVGILLSACSRNDSSPGASPSKGSGSVGASENTGISDRSAQSASTSGATFLEIARYPDGKVKQLNQKDAVEYCKCESDYARNTLGCSTPANSAHLPSAPELAQLSVSFGSKGVVDSCSTGEGCSIIPILDGTKDSFYFSYSGYQRPAGDQGMYWFWSSSVEAKVPNPGIVLRGDEGSLDTFNPEYNVAVRCMAGR